MTDGSPGQRIQREIVLLLAWAPAILLQLAHPLVAQGVSEHSAFQTQRWGRLRRLHTTIDAMLALSFGTAAESRAAAARINAIHDRVHGRLAEGGGRFAAGTPYSAHDPVLLAWVHATLLTMNLEVYRRYVGDLSPEEQDRYCLESSVMESHLGIPEGRLPRSVAELRGYVETMLASGEIAVTGTARQVGWAIVYPPALFPARPLLWLLRLPAIGLLPPAIREAYAFPWRPLDEVNLRRSAWFTRHLLLPLTPSFLRHWRAAQHRRRSSPPHRAHRPESLPPVSRQLPGD